MEKTKRILIIDNDEAFLTKLQILFEDAQYQTTLAWGGREVLTQGQLHGFDLILLSDYLPDVNYQEFWREFRGLAGSASVALLESDPPVNEMLKVYRQAGGNCVLAKASPSKIAEAARGCLDSNEKHILSPTSRNQTAARNL